jgi:hypothetical protein
MSYPLHFCCQLIGDHVQLTCVNHYELETKDQIEPYVVTQGLGRATELAAAIAEGREFGITFTARSAEV